MNVWLWTFVDLRQILPALSEEPRRSKKKNHLDADEVTLQKSPETFNLKPEYIKKKKQNASSCWNSLSAHARAHPRALEALLHCAPWNNSRLSSFVPAVSRCHDVIADPRLPPAPAPVESPSGHRGRLQENVFLFYFLFHSTLCFQVSGHLLEGKQKTLSTR